MTFVGLKRISQHSPQPKITGLDCPIMQFLAHGDANHAGCDDCADNCRHPSVSGLRRVRCLVGHPFDRVCHASIPAQQTLLLQFISGLDVD